MLKIPLILGKSAFFDTDLFPFHKEEILRLFSTLVSGSAFESYNCDAPKPGGPLTTVNLQKPVCLIS